MENFTDVDAVVKTRKGALGIVFEGFSFEKSKRMKGMRLSTGGAVTRVLAYTRVRQDDEVCKSHKTSPRPPPNKRMGFAAKTIDKIRASGQRKSAG